MTMSNSLESTTDDDNKENVAMNVISPSKQKRRKKTKNSIKRSSSSVKSSSRRKRRRPTETEKNKVLLFALLILTVMVTLEVFFIEQFFFQNEPEVNIQYLSKSALKGYDKPDSLGQIEDFNKIAASSTSNIPKLRDPIYTVSEALNIPQQDIPLDVKEKLPSKEEVTKLYGDAPRILGLDTCQTFRNTVRNEDAFIAPAGMFNTGTNLMHEYLHHNCYLPGKVRKYGKISRGMRFQVPWGKHTPASFRLHHIASDATDTLDQTAFLPILVIKDPFTWMQSMCRHSYAAFWPHESVHCPNLVPMHPFEKADKNGNVNTNSVHVNVKYSAKSKDLTTYESLAHLWNEWYGEWLNVTSYPHLVVRFEDLVFHAETIVTEVCHCAGGVMRAYDDHNGEHDEKEGFQYISESAKQGQKVHAGASGFTTAMIKHGSETARTDSFTKEDMEFAKKVLRKDIMEAFHYVMPSSPS